MTARNAWVQIANELTFPNWMPNNLRTKIRSTVIALPSSPDDEEDTGLVVFPPEECGDTTGLAVCVTDKRVAKAYKEVLGDIVGTPPAENIDNLMDFINEECDENWSGDED